MAYSPPAAFTVVARVAQPLRDAEARDEIRLAFRPGSILLLNGILGLLMLGVALVFVPIVLIYQAWTYNLFKGKITGEDLSY